MPSGVSAKFENNTLTVSGPKGTLSQTIDSEIRTIIDGQNLSFEIATESATSNAKHGLYRALAHNMVVGVSEGFAKTLQISGVGYKASVSGNKLVMNLGFSHPVEMVCPEGISVKSISNTEIELSGIDKQKVSEFAAKIREIRSPEPYKGKGIRYKGEHVRRKEGKKAAK